MRQILKETPITIDGIDKLEVLVRDDSVYVGDICAKCCYNDWSPSDGDPHDCSLVHDCFSQCKTWFEIHDLK